MGFYVYILASGRNGTLYVGHTDDLNRRIFEHQSKAVPGFTAKYGVTQLVHFELFETREAAFARERALKKWNRLWKIRLIERFNPAWRDLALDLQP
jgi:putative endonuclease